MRRLSLAAELFSTYNNTIRTTEAVVIWCILMLFARERLLINYFRDSTRNIINTSLDCHERVDMDGTSAFIATVLASTHSSLAKVVWFKLISLDPFNAGIPGYTCVYIYIHIEIERERERESKGQGLLNSGLARSSQLLHGTSVAINLGIAAINLENALMSSEYFMHPPVPSSNVGITMS